MEKQTFDLKKERFTLSYGEPYKLDKHDKAILLVLNEDARQSLSDISHKVGLSRDAIRNRIKKMIKADVIHSFRPILNPPRLGYPIINYVFLSLINPSVEREENLVKHLMAHPNIVYAATLIGKWDYVIYIMAKNPGEFETIIKGLRQKFPDLIKEYEVYGVLNEFKYEEVAKLVQ